MRQHVTLLGILLIVQGAVGLIGAFTMAFFLVGAGLLSGEVRSAAATSTLGTLIGLYFVILAVPSLVAGLGLLNRKPWARLLALIVCCLALLKIPLGTALGIYGLWTLTKAESAALFAAADRSPTPRGQADQSP